MANTSRYGKLLWGAGTWASNAATSVTVTGAFLGQGLLTAGNTVSFSVTFLGQGLMSQVLMVMANFVGQGFFYQVTQCLRDCLLTAFLWPQATAAVVMPIAYVTQVNQPDEIPLCGPTTTTTPVTGSLATLTELNGFTQNNP